MALNSAQLIATGQLDGFRNRIINGDMRIDQRNAGANVTLSGTSGTAAYSMDRWATSAFANGTSLPAGVFLTLSTDTDVPSASTAGTNFRKSLKATLNQNITWSGAIASSPLGLWHRQVIEGLNVADLGFGATGAASFTLSFWVKATKTGTFSVSFQNAATDRSYVTTFTVASANTWQKFIVTIPGDTTGTWATDNTEGLNVTFVWSGNSAWIGTSTLNSWQAVNVAFSSTQTQMLTATNDAVWFTGVQLEKGPVATDFDFRSYPQELAMCQRYYYVTRRTGRRNLGWLIPYTNDLNTSQSSLGYISFPVIMRSAPTGTITVSGDGIYAGNPFSYNNLLDSALYPEGAVVLGPWNWAVSGDGGTVSSSAFAFTSEL